MHKKVFLNVISEKIVFYIFRLGPPKFYLFVHLNIYFCNFNLICCRPFVWSRVCGPCGQGSWLVAAAPPIRCDACFPGDRRTLGVIPICYYTNTVPPILYSVFLYYPSVPPISPCTPVHQYTISPCTPAVILESCTTPPLRWWVTPPRTALQYSSTVYYTAVLDSLPWCSTGQCNMI